MDLDHIEQECFCTHPVNEDTFWAMVVLGTSWESRTFNVKLWDGRPNYNRNLMLFEIFFCFHKTTKCYSDLFLISTPMHPSTLAQKKCLELVLVLHSEKSRIVDASQI